ncbi:MAG: hypothetical protein GTO24_18245 [candidate division Zixibacteria bacterium]|nr:hypothetical protein [candidate division Zixibacteria bacterium]
MVTLSGPAFTMTLQTTIPRCIAMSAAMAVTAVFPSMSEKVHQWVWADEPEMTFGLVLSAQYPDEYD